MKTIKYIKSILEFNKHIIKDNFDDIKKWAYEYVKGNYEGFNTLDDAIEYLGDFFEHVYAEIMKNDNVKLYRVILVNNIKDINKKNIGIHTVLDVKVLYDSDFLEDIGIDNYTEDDVELYIIEILTTIDNINWEHTIDTRLRFPQEMEITLKDNWKGKVKILKYDKLKIV